MAYVALAMNPPMQVSSSNSLVSLAMTVLLQEWLRQNHNWEQELWFRDGVRTYTRIAPTHGYEPTPERRWRVRKELAGIIPPREAERRG
jgi:hypothetical protein